jgi:ArsR family transcriptional regulator, arsenate/arsenite/antimonite-responsive transcriptional repressor
LKPETDALPKRASTSKPMALSESQCVQIAKALADPSRWRIVQTLRARQAGHREPSPSSCGLTCSDVGQICPQRQPTISHHVRTLERSGLVTLTRQGQFHLLTLNAEVLEAWIAGLGGPMPPAARKPRPVNR